MKAFFYKKMFQWGVELSLINVSNLYSKCYKKLFAVGEWSYPLLESASPVLHSFYGAYVFPDPSHPDRHVAVIVPDSVSREDRDLFETVLSGLTSYHTQIRKVGFFFFLGGAFFQVGRGEHHSKK